MTAEYVADDVHLHADEYGGWTLSFTDPDGTRHEVGFVPASVERIVAALGLVRIDAVVASFASKGLIAANDVSAGAPRSCRTRRRRRRP